MFRRLKQRINDMHTIRSLLSQAELSANADGQREPGLEHVVLAALALPDGTARKAFGRVGADPDQFRNAIRQQYADALQRLGIDPAALDAAGDAAVAPGAGPYQAGPAVQTLMQQLANRPKAHACEPLLGAHVIAEVARARHGVAPRALRTMGIDPVALHAAAEQEIRSAAMP